MTTRQIGICALLGLSAGVAFADDKGRGGEKEGGAGAAVKYRRWNDTIEIKDGVLRRTQFVFKFPDDDPSPNPTDVQKVEYEVKVDAAAAKDLLAAIDKAKFSDLKREYGAPKDQRHYLYEITVGSKTVTYRSNPSYEDAPDAFHDVERKIVQFADRATRGKKAKKMTPK